MRKIKGFLWGVGMIGLVGIVGILTTRQTNAQAIPAWICTPANAPYFQGSGYVANIACSDGQGHMASEQIAVPTSPSATWAGDAVQQFISQLTAQQNNNKLLPPPGTAIAPSAVKISVTPPPPTGFAADYPVLLECQSAIAQQLISASDNFCTNQLSKVQAEFNADEVNLLESVSR